MSSASVRTNSQLPVPCSELSNSGFVNHPSSQMCVTSASCSPWQSRLGRDVSRSDCRERDETPVKSPFEPAASANFDLRSDAGAVHNARSCEPQTPFYVDQNDVSSRAENLISLHTNVSADADRNVNESRLSCDGVDDTTVVDASADHDDQTSTRPGYIAALHYIIT